MTTSDDDIPSPLEEVDWNFSAVPESEIVACCLWEFSRESRSISMAADLLWCHMRTRLDRERYAADPKAMAVDDVEAERIQNRAKAIGFDYDLFGEKFWALDLAHVEIYACTITPVCRIPFTSA